MPASQEADLLARARAGDAEAFEDLLVPHLPMLFAYCRAICGDYHWAQDVVQETALIAYRNLNHLFPEVDLASWLKAIARRQALAARRQAARLGTWAEEALEAAYADPGPETLAPERDALARCLEGLDPRSGRLVRGHYFEGLRLTQLADALGLNLNTVKTLLYRARLSLKDCMQRRLRMEGLS
jgi:RNA polymerase sigma factor (sigma-70 family)